MMQRIARTFGIKRNLQQASLATLKPLEGTMQCILHIYGISL
jgi:hypothetical protein